MAQRLANRFALLTVYVPPGEAQVSAADLTGALRDSLFTHWGELNLAVAGSALKIVFLEYLDKTCALAILRFPRDFQVQVLSACSLLLDCADSTVSVRVHRVAGRLKNSGNHGIDAALLWRKQTGARVDPLAIEKLRQLPEYA
jgi:RNase P/RNase MRP subunit POP5